MKFLKKIIALSLIAGFSMISASMINCDKKQETSHAYTREGFLDWDEENKLIYAYQNSLIIARDGDGTTIYLDRPSDYVEGETLVSGDGILTSKDISLMDIYNQNPSDYQIAPPADGANLSDWSIVFGGKNVNGTPSSQVKMKVTMTGGDIKNIYAGHSSFEFSVNNELRGVNEFTMTGGSVNSIYTDNGYDEFEQSGRAKGAANITFNLFGGTIQNLVRDTLNVQRKHNSTINLKGDIKISNGIKFYSTHFGEKLNIVGNLANAELLNFDLNSNFERSDVLFNLDSSISDDFNTNLISLKNKPTGSDDWQIYKSSNAVRYGYSSKITSISIAGETMVDKTLSIVTNPTKATIESATWFRKDAYLGSSTIIGAGESYTLKEEDGGKIVYVEVVDKNNPSEKFIAETTGVIKRIDLPQIVTENGKTTVYANGNDLIVAGNANESTIYLDAGVIGVLENTDISLKTAGIENAFDDASDLSNITISAGCSNDKNSGDIAVTIVSGEVGEIVVQSTNGEKLVSNIVINLFGGKVNNVVANKQNVAIETVVNLAGNIKAKLNGIQNNFGPTKLNLLGEITSENGSLTIALDKSLFVEESLVIGSENSEHINLSKFVFVDTNGEKINTFKVSMAENGVVFSPIPVEGVKIDGSLRVNKTLTAKLTPNNANATFKWLKSSTNNIEDAEVIEGATNSTYKLTKDDLGKFIFVIVNEGTDNEFIAGTSKTIAKAFPAWLIVLIVILSVIVLGLISLIIWFVLWKSKKAKAFFLEGVFEKIDGVFSKNQKQASKETKNKNKK